MTINGYKLKIIISERFLIKIGTLMKKIRKEIWSN
tara:strand:- start:144 stop:248 length:105 start_codon:yes stop_codon:yes gene_type:complete